MLSSLFATAAPREDVLEGTLAESIFAASLEEVVNGKAPAVYSDPATFFAGTHPSAGLRALLDEALGRIGYQRAGEGIRAHVVLQIKPSGMSPVPARDRARSR
jgi:predicted AAA+ superfamily ATPase